MQKPILHIIIATLIIGLLPATLWTASSAIAAENALILRTVSVIDEDEEPQAAGRAAAAALLKQTR